MHNQNAREFSPNRSLLCAVILAGRAGKLFYLLGADFFDDLPLLAFAALYPAFFASSSVMNFPCFVVP